MNVNELIEQYENDLKREDKRIGEGFARLFDEGYTKGSRRTHIKVIDDLKQLSNVEYNHKIKIPQFVAGYIEYAKQCLDLNIITATHWVNVKSNLGEGLAHKFCNWLEANVETYCNAWLDGYEVEEDPKYYVAIPTEFDPLAKLYFVGFENVIDPLFIGYKEKAFKFDNFEKAKGIAQLITGNVEEVNK